DAVERLGLPPLAVADPVRRLQRPVHVTRLRLLVRDVGQRDRRVGPGEGPLDGALEVAGHGLGGRQVVLVGAALLLAQRLQQRPGPAQRLGGALLVAGPRLADGEMIQGGQLARLVPALCEYLLRPAGAARARPASASAATTAAAARLAALGSFNPSAVSRAAVISPSRAWAHASAASARSLPCSAVMLLARVAACRSVFLAPSRSP